MTLVAQWLERIPHNQWINSSFRTVSRKLTSPLYSNNGILHLFVQMNNHRLNMLKLSKVGFCLLMGPEAQHKPYICINFWLTWITESSLLFQNPWACPRDVMNVSSLWHCKLRVCMDVCTCLQYCLCLVIYQGFQDSVVPDLLWTWPENKNHPSGLLQQPAEKTCWEHDLPLFAAISVNINIGDMYIVKLKWYIWRVTAEPWRCNNWISCFLLFQKQQIDAEQSVTHWNKRNPSVKEAVCWLHHICLFIFCCVLNKWNFALYWLCLFCVNK